MDMAALTGSVRLHPGSAGPAISGARPLLASRVARGRAAAELPAVLGALFTLCSHAHRSTAHRAVSAALGDPALSTPADRSALRAATARDQILRIAHDWHRLLPGAPAGEPALTLRSCPLWREDFGAAEQMAALPEWLAHRWLMEPLHSWLAAHEADPPGHVQRWCEQADTPPARLLRTQRRALQALATPAQPLRLLDQPLAQMPRLAQRMAEEPGFCARPDWHGVPAETGPWTRSVDPLPLPLHNAWMRLIARLVDVLRLAAPSGRDWLAEGALPLAPGEAIAWTEMARGLLVHWVRLEDSPQGPRVADCRVLAPTEWNFHPQGVLAQTLATLRGEEAIAQAARAAVAFDPCVEFMVEATPEPAHA
ncbi:hypothetical protein [Variovorax sp. YR752]|uniref:hypothetical protein n=1 Tax=Variovorax sp. YR752 TaxID=1884383 RepID=UPI0031378DB2